MMNENLTQIAVPLLAWFEKNARVLPWRTEPLPYYVWISEIMLQQTRVEAVKPYFRRFTDALPDLKALAECPEDRLLKLWEGLGYYNRVRNMQKAARIVIEQYGGELPADYEALLGLPGIGSYTAGAIASIAYGIAVPAVDGNVLRVISRVTENEEDILKQAVRHRMEETLQAVIPQECPGVFNQALMELGALVCLPNGKPDCGRCPLRELCLARMHDRLDEIPHREARKKRRVEEKTVLVLQDGMRTVIRKRPRKGLLAGLYELPSLPGRVSEQDVIAYLREEQFRPVQIRPLPEAKHIFSHVEWQMSGYLVLVEDMEADRPADPGYLVVEPGRIQQEYSIPSAFAAYIKYIESR